MKKKISVLILPFLAFAAAWLISKGFLKIIDKYHYICPIYIITGYLCPGCGGTRALKYMLSGHLFISLKCNPSVILISLFILFSYIQLFTETFFKRKKIIPGNKYFYIVLTGIMILFYILRNFIPQLMPV